MDIFEILGPDPRDPHENLCGSETRSEPNNPCMEKWLKFFIKHIPEEYLAYFGKNFQTLFPKNIFSWYKESHSKVKNIENKTENIAPSRNWIRNTGVTSCDFNFGQNFLLCQ